MSATRLANVGLFQKMGYADEVEDEEVKKILKLHRAVLDKALLDSFSPAKHIRDEIDSWLYLENKDFLDACERAMLPPKQVFYVFKIMKKILRGKNAKFREFGRYMNRENKC